MKVKVWVKYEESYLPPRCRKLRYRECEDHVSVSLPETTMSSLRLAFEDNSYGGPKRIYFYKGKLWRTASVRDICVDSRAEKYTPLDNLIWVLDHSSIHFYVAGRRELYNMDASRTSAMKRVRTDIRKYLLVDGDLYIRTSEPRYCIYTFGLGHNHGGTCLSVDYGYNPNISRDRYFSALQSEDAVAEATRIAAQRGDTESIERIKGRITVYAPDLVKVNPKRQHGKGNPFLNKLNAITDVAPDAFTAGLLCVGSAVVD